MEDNFKDVFEDISDGARPWRRHVDAGDNTLDILYQEYVRALESGDRKFDHVLRITGIGFATAGALLFLLSGRREAVDEWVYWIAPLMLTLLYAWVIQLLHYMAFSSYYARDLEDDIAKRIGIKYFHQEHTNVRALNSFRSSVHSMRVTYALMLTFAAVIYIGLVSVGFVQIRDHIKAPLWRQELYVLLYGVLALSLLYSAIGITAHLRPVYERWKYVRASTYGAIRRKNLPVVNTEQLVSYAILPRKLDFVFKAALTGACLVATSLILGTGLSIWLMWVGFLVVFCVDFLAKQATYIWNDVLDLTSDRIHPSKLATRRLGAITTDTTVAHRIGVTLFAVRFVASLGFSIVIGARLDLVWLLPLVIVVFVFQWGYDRWAKRGPVSRIVVASLGYGERSVAGSLAAMAVAGRYDLLLVAMLSAWVVVYMLVVLTAYWWAERNRYWSERYGEQFTKLAANQHADRPWVWTLENGLAFEDISLAILILVGLVLALAYAPGLEQRFMPIAAPLAQSAGYQLTDLKTTIGSAASTFWSRELVHGTTKVEYLVIALALLALLSLRVTLEARKSVTESNRFRRTLGATAFLAVALVATPADVRLLAAALVLPLIVAVSYAKLSQDEIEKFERSMQRFVGEFPARLERVLFLPWCVRVSIRPVADDGRVEDNDWPGRLRDMYGRWGLSLKGTVRIHDASCDGGERHDFFVEAPTELLLRLRDEAGLHRSVVRVMDQDGAVYLHQQLAEVMVRSVSVPTRAAFGGGLEKIESMSLDMAIRTPADHLVRHYFGTVQGQGSTSTLVYQHIYELDRQRFPLCVDSTLNVTLHRADDGCPQGLGNCQEGSLTTEWWPDSPEATTQPGVAPSGQTDAPA